MAYTKTQWVNNTTPINDTNLNKIEQGIYDNSLVTVAIADKLNPTDTETYKTAELTEGQITDVIAVNDIVIKGQTSQNGEPTPSSPVDVNVVSGSNVINTSNKNLLNLDFVADSDSFVGLSFSHSKSEFSLKGTATGTYKTFMLKNKINFVESNQYTLSAEIAGINPKMQIRIMAYDSSNQLIWSIAINKSNNYKNTSTFNPSAEIDHYTFVIESLENGGAYNLTAKIQLEQNSTATTYETHQGKELPLDLPVENLLQNTATSQTINGVNFTVNEDKSIRVTGTATANAILILNTLSLNGIYTLSGCPKNGSSSTYKLDLQPSEGGDPVADYGNGVQVNISESKSYRARIVIYNGAKVNDLLFTPQLEQGSKANAYTPFGTDPIELCKIGDYQDYFYKSGSKWYLHKEIGKKVLDGITPGKRLITKHPSITSETKGFYQFNIADKIAGTVGATNLGISNYFKFVGSNAQNAFNNNSSGIWWENTIACYLILEETTLADANNWLATYNTTIYYVLATATNTEITDTTLISQLEAIYNAPLYEQTNITQTNNDLPMVLDITACKDNINGIKAFIRK